MGLTVTTVYTASSTVSVWGLPSGLRYVSGGYRNSRSSGKAERKEMSGRGRGRIGVNLNLLLQP